MHPGLVLQRVSAWSVGDANTGNYCIPNPAVGATLFHVLFLRKLRKNTNAWRCWDCSYLQERASEVSKSSSASPISHQRGEEEYEEQLPTGGGGNFSINARDLGKAKTRRSIRVTKSYNPNFPPLTGTVTKDLSQLEIKQLEFRSAS